MQLSEFSRQTKTPGENTVLWSHGHLKKNLKYYMSKLKEEFGKTAHGVACCVAKPKQTSILPGTLEKK